MSKLLIALPCTAQELENALHAVCDHHGLWDAKVVYHISLDPNVSWGLVIETETKGGQDEETQDRPAVRN